MVGGAAVLATVTVGEGVNQVAHQATHAVEHAVDAVNTSIKINEDGPVPLNKGQLKELPKVYFAKEGNTIFSISSAEGSAVANNPEALWNAEQLNAGQLPKSQRKSEEVKPGDEFHLPQGSEIGTDQKQ